MITLALLLVAAIGAADPSTLRDAIRAAGSEFNGLPAAPVDGEIEVRWPDRIAATRSRVDLFAREKDRWVPQAHYRGDPRMKLRPAAMERLLLIRQEERPLYAAAVVHANSTRSVNLMTWKDVAVDADRDAVLTYFTASEPEPRFMPRAQSVFHQLPVEPALLCASRPLTSRCIAVDPNATSAAIAVGDAASVRVVYSQQPREVAVREPGRFLTIPKAVDVSIVHAAPWLALHGVPWTELVVDFASPEAATERVAAAILPPLPSFHPLPFRTERGIVVRPLAGTRKTAINDPSAVLLVLTAHGEDPGARVPIASAKPDDRGHFVFPELGSGLYVLKLLSSAASGDPVSFAASAGMAADVVFPTGAILTGRVVRALGGDPAVPVRVEVLSLRPPDSKGEVELIDYFRVATAEMDGRFSVVLPSPGAYRLRARWGPAEKEVEFELPKNGDEVDVGEIVLDAGVILHGRMAGCGGGEVVLVPLPERATGATLQFPSSRSATIGADGRFLVRGLTRGSWSTFMNCGGSAVEVTPRIVIIAPPGEPVIEFQRRGDN